MVHGVSVVVAPVLQVDAEAVVAVVGQQVELLVAQPVFSSRLPKAAAVLRPAAVKTHRAVTAPLEHCPAPAWCTHRYVMVKYRCTQIYPLCANVEYFQQHNNIIFKFICFNQSQNFDVYSEFLAKPMSHLLTQRGRVYDP